LKMMNRIRRRYDHSSFAVRLSALVSIFAFLLLIAPQLSAQVTANPALEIFNAPGATQAFTITVSSGTSLGSFSVLTLGAPNLDFTSVPAGTSCPNVVAGTCTIVVKFQPTAPSRRQGAVVLSDPSGNVLLSVSLDAAGDAPLAAFGPGIISTFAGNGTGGDGGPAISALLGGPTGITVDGFGNHYIADQKGNKIRKVTAAGVISTFAGTGSAGYSGDGGAATSATLSGPMSVLVDGAGFV
jgi:large repetitive protein